MIGLLISGYVYMLFFMLGFFMGADDANKGPKEYTIMLLLSCGWPVIVILWLFERIREWKQGQL